MRDVSALTDALVRAGIAKEHHTVNLFTSFIRTSKEAAPCWILYLSDSRNGDITRFLFSGAPVVSKQHVIHFANLLNVTDEDRAAAILTVAVELRAIRSSDGVVESSYDPKKQ